MTKIASKKDTSIADIRPYFSWLNDTLSNIIKEVSNNFWKFEPEIKLFSLEKNSKNFFAGNNYFVSQAETNGITYAIRLSESACEIFLSQTLGDNGNKFPDLADLTELEGDIITKFNTKTLSALKDFMLTKKEIEKMLDKDESFDNYINLGFVIKAINKNNEDGKLFLSIPAKFIKYPELPPTEGGVDITQFTKALTPVDIFVGKTKLSLDEINNIEPEDIVVLEKSNIKQMSIISPTNFNFNVNPDPRLFINDNNSDDNSDDNTQTEDITVSTKDIWDNVQVDVCAKFPKVKMSLGELREMAEGVVLELDSVYGNEVVLEVENKNVAKGELVIVGYKYGVKITEIYSSNPEANETSTSQPTQHNSDDFDVKDFEIEE